MVGIIYLYDLHNSVASYICTGAVKQTVALGQPVRRDRDSLRDDCEMRPKTDPLK